MPSTNSSKKPLVLVQPGVSILGIDAGGTTGVALWDAWDRRLYVDHVDAGRGRKVRMRVASGIVESPSMRNFEQIVLDRWAKEGVPDYVPKEVEELRRSVKAGNGLKGGRRSEIEVLSELESQIVTLLVDLIVAAGPRTIVMVEDFVLGATGGVSGARAGLSSVRLAHKLHDRCLTTGVLSGDVWRQWQGHAWAGGSGHGWRIRGGRDGVPSFLYRLNAAERWRLHDEWDASDPRVDRWDGGEGSIWNGRGAKWFWNLPSQRRMPWCKTVAEMDAWMKERGTWVNGLRHGMDALQHVLVCAHRMGAEITAEPERLWEPGKRSVKRR